MKRESIMAAFMICGVLCIADGKGPAETEPTRPVSATAPVISTNALIRALQGATNLPFLDSAWKVYRDHTVFLNQEGHLAARFDVVSVFSTEYELLSKLAECLAGSTVRVRSQPGGGLLYINEAGDKFTIRIVHDECDQDHFQGVYYLTGIRRFFTIKALLHVESRPSRDGAIDYGAHIYADSDSRIVNFVLRIHAMKNYLLREMNDVVAKFDILYEQMIHDPPANLQKVMGFRDPKGTLYFSDPDMARIVQFADRLSSRPPAPGSP